MTISVDPSTWRPRIDPRLRQRWIDVRREEGRRRLRLVIALVTVVVLLTAAYGVLHSPLLRVRHVRVALASVPAGSGLSVAQIERQAGLDRERLMESVSTGREAELVEQLPWVATARVERDWPGTIRIAVTARHPVAELDRVPSQPASGVALLDATGRVLSLSSGVGSGPGASPSVATPPGSPSVAGAAIPTLPLLGSLPTPGAPGTWVLPGPGGGGAAGAGRPAGGSEVAGGGGATGDNAEPAPEAAGEELATAAALPPALARRVSTITHTPEGLALGVGPVTVYFGNTGSLQAKVTSLGTILSHVSLAQVRSIDLRVPDRPALTSWGDGQ